MRHNATYTFLFAAAVCIVCGVLVSTSAVSLKDLQEKNAKLDKMRNVLMVACLARSDEKLSGEEIHKRFQAIKPVVIDLATGELADSIDPETYDQRAAAADPELSKPAPPNSARVKRLPKYALVYEVLDKDGFLDVRDIDDVDVAKAAVGQVELVAVEDRFAPQAMLGDMTYAGFRWRSAFVRGCEQQAAPVDDQSLVAKGNRTATADEIRAWCKERLAKYKVPTEVEFRDELPKTTVGKIDSRDRLNFLTGPNTISTKNTFRVISNDY